MSESDKSDSHEAVEDEAPQPVALTEDGIPMVVNGQPLSEVAIQALREARARKQNEPDTRLPTEVGGADRTTDPTRYGDWEKNGRSVDFS